MLYTIYCMLYTLYCILYIYRDYDGESIYRTKLPGHAGITLLRGKHKKTNIDHVITVLFDRTMFVTDEQAKQWFIHNKKLL